MRKKIVAGNWKMHGSPESVTSLCEGLVNGVNASAPECALIVFPPFVYLSQVQAALAGAQVHLGAQNVSQFDEGAYTGEISINMLKASGCEYVLIGHSERRHVFGETLETVVAKFKQAKQMGLTPILCVGETLEEREADKTSTVLAAQLQSVCEALPGDTTVFDGAVIAYEPVWAIGTGKSATPEQAQAVHAQIRQFLTEIGQINANSVSVLYGGSVKSDNAAQLFEQPDIDGALVGGASLDADQFMRIASCNKSS